MKDNGLLSEEAGQALASALASNSVLTELDVSAQGGYSFDDGPGFFRELAIGIKNSEAILSLNISGNDLTGYLSGQTDMAG
jgi:hypothetical protein